MTLISRAKTRRRAFEQGYRDGMKAEARRDICGPTKRGSYARAMDREAYSEGLEEGIQLVRDIRAHEATPSQYSSARCPKCRSENPFVCRALHSNLTLPHAHISDNDRGWRCCSHPFHQSRCATCGGSGKDPKLYCDDPWHDGISIVQRTTEGRA
jgi:hypothetical protein